MTAKNSLLELILSFFPYLRSVKGRFILSQFVIHNSAYSVITGLSSVHQSFNVTEEKIFNVALKIRNVFVTDLVMYN